MEEETIVLLKEKFPESKNYHAKSKLFTKELPAKILNFIMFKLI